MKSATNLIVFSTLLALFISGLLFAAESERYWIFFADKGELESLSAFQQEKIIHSQMTPRAIARRRMRSSLAAFSKISIMRDLPVNPDYVEIVKQMGFSIHQKLRWVNAVSGYAPDRVLEQISRLPFVKSVERVKRFAEKNKVEAPLSTEPAVPSQPRGIYNFDYGGSLKQAEFHNIPALHQQGLTGEGVLIGIFDTGFNLDHPALQHISQSLIAEWDFINNDSITKNQPGDPLNQDYHGTATLSALAGFDEGKLIGVAFNAQYFLAKTESENFERHVEEDNWAAAAERADSLGIDIVTTSLGYSEFDFGEGDYAPEDMDGETTIITQAANFLTDRGVIVIASAGNEGDNNWHIITAPADGKSVIAVGAVNSSNVVASFSSRGPTADGRIKPDVVGLGVSVFAARSSNQGYQSLNGTSMSCPLVAGICALVMEKFPDLTVSDMLQIIRYSGDTSSPNNDRGWGKVDAVRALTIAGGGSLEPAQFTVKLLNFSPFQNQTIFGIGLPKSSPITIDIYNVLGQRVRVLFYSGGAILNPVIWDRRNENGMPVASGIYPFRVRTNFGAIDSKVVIIR
jgi:serine protease AprX